MDKSISKNYIYNTAYQIFAIIVPFITTPYVSRLLGVENIGIYSYTSTVVAYFITFSQLGFNLYGSRLISYIRDDKEKLSLVFRQLVVLRIIFFSIGICSYLIMLFFVKEYRHYYYIYLILVFANSIDITWLFQGFEEFHIISIRNFIVRIINTACIFLFVRTKESLPIYILIYCLSEFVSRLVMWIGVRKRITTVSFKWNGCLGHVKGALVMFAPQTIITIYTYADKMILGILSTETQVGLYSQSERIVKLALTIISSMGTVMLPRIGNMYSNGNYDEIAKLLNRSKKFVYFLSFPIICGLIGISDNFVSWFFGAGYEDVAGLMCILSPIILFIGLSDLYGTQFLIPLGRMKEYTIAVAVGAGLNVLLNVILANRIGAFGVSISTVVSELTVTWIMKMISEKYIHLDRKVPIVYIFSALIMGIVIKVVDINLPHKFYLTFLEILIGGTIYFGILYLFRDEFFMYIIKRILIKKRI